MDRNYSITIEVNGMEKGESPIAGDNKPSDTEKASGGSINKIQAKTLAATLTAYHTVKSFATQVINHEVSLVSLRTGSNEMQERASFINENVQTAVGVGESLIAGAIAGGPVGAIIALGGVALNVGHRVMAIAQKQETLNIERSIEKETIQKNYIRAGAKGYRSNE